MAKAEKRPDPLERARAAGLTTLFEAHPTGFVAARNALAAILKKAGDAEAAAAVRALARPSLPLWAVNQLARRAQKELRALLEVTGELREAQLQARAADLRALTERHRALLKSLRAEAAALLELSPNATSAQLDRVHATLLAASAGTEGQREQLLQGELREELSPPGFDLFAGAAVPAKASAEKGREQEEGADAPVREAKARKGKAREEKARKEKAREEKAREEKTRAKAAAEEALQRLSKALAEAEAAHGEAVAALDQARAKEEETREAVAALRRQHQAAETTLRRLT